MISSAFSKYQAFSQWNITVCGLKQIWILYSHWFWTNFNSFKENGYNCKKNNSVKNVFLPCEQGSNLKGKNLFLRKEFFHFSRPPFLRAMMFRKTKSQKLCLSGKWRKTYHEYHPLKCWWSVLALVLLSFEWWEEMVLLRNHYRGQQWGKTTYTRR